VGAEREWGKRVVRVNVVQILYTPICKWKVIPVEAIPEMEGQGDKGE
jgi:hypothetical protein